MKRLLEIIKAHKIISIIIASVIVVGATCGVLLAVFNPFQQVENKVEELIDEGENKLEEKKDEVEEEVENKVEEVTTNTPVRSNYTPPAETPAPAPQPSAEELHAQLCQSIFDRWLPIAKQYEIDNYYNFNAYNSYIYHQEYLQTIRGPYVTEMKNNDCDPLLYPGFPGLT